MKCVMRKGVFGDYVYSENLNQPAHPPLSLIKAFTLQN